MKQNDPTTDKLIRIAEPVCTGSGYELVDLSLMPSREGWVLRVFIDHLTPAQVPAGHLTPAHVPAGHLMPAQVPAGPRPGPDDAAPDVEGREAGDQDVGDDEPGDDSDEDLGDDSDEDLGDDGDEDLGDDSDEDLGDDSDEEGSEISFEDCERVSRELGAVLDVEDPIGHAYRLEVSSPGLDRPLRTLAHFQRFLGHEAKIKLHDGIDGRHNYKGKLLAVTPSAAEPAGARAIITVEVDGKQHELPFDDIESARLVPDWDAIMGKRAGKPGHS
jgi:ribosome maturation factor RimP